MDKTDGVRPDKLECSRGLLLVEESAFFNSLLFFIRLERRTSEGTGKFSSSIEEDGVLRSDGPLFVRVVSMESFIRENEDA
jgi:hypothetical protein